MAAFGQKAIYALFNRDLPTETVKEITFDEFMSKLALGYTITEQNTRRLVLTKENRGEERAIYIYLPAAE